MASYFTQDGRQVAPAFSMQGAVRGQYLLDRVMIPPQPKTVTRISTTAGVWQRAQLRMETAAHINTPARSETVDAWLRV